MEKLFPLIYVTDDPFSGRKFFKGQSHTGWKKFQYVVDHAVLCY